MAARMSSDDYSVGWICAVPCELEAAERALDRKHPSPPKLAANDQNVYICGEIHSLNVVIACPPVAEYGTTTATITAQHMNASFKSLRYRFMVGVGGGAPSESNDIRLGDIVVSTPVGNDSGVIPYDWGKTVQSGEFQQIGILNKPPRSLRIAVTRLKALQNFDSHLAATLSSILTTGNHIMSPGPKKDRLFASSYPHPGSVPTCNDCDVQSLIRREQRTSGCPRVHYGLIASGNQVMKDAIKRDELAKSRGILCFEMEAAGLMDEFECLVVRGICDYSDSHKNKNWQPYAAASAAAYVKALLGVLSFQSEDPSRKKEEISPAMGGILRKLFVTDPSEDRRDLMARRGGPTQNTCEWIFKTDELEKWLNIKPEDQQPQDSILWLNGTPGSGKSTLAMLLTERLEQDFEENRKADSFAYFFCESNHDKQNTAASILRGILWQIIRQNPILEDWLVRRFQERSDALPQSFNALWSILAEVAIDSRCGVVYCIIDALDECDSESQLTILKQLKLSFNDRPSRRFTSKIRILITSRPYEEIDNYLGIYPSRDIATFVEERKNDIQIFIKQKVDDLAIRKGYHNDLKVKIKRSLEEKAGITFLWVGLTCDELINFDPQDTLAFLDNLAPDLNAIYTQLMKKIMENTQKRERIYSILAVVSIARRALSLLELCMACSLYIGEESEAMIAFVRADVKSCRLMVVESEGLVNLLHKSVKDFLFGSQPSSFPTIQESHAKLAYKCINYTAKHFSKPNRVLEDLLDEFIHRIWSSTSLVDEIKKEVSKLDEFISYCGQYWIEHAQLSGSTFDVAKVQETSFLAFKSSSRERWQKYYSFKLRGNSVPRQFGILHIAAKWGILSLVHSALGDNVTEENDFYVDTDFLASDASTPLEQAAKWGNMNVFTELMSRVKPSTMITNTVLAAVLRHNYNREDCIANLLESLGSRIIVNEELEIAAVRNERGPEILRILFAHRDKTPCFKGPSVAESVLIAAAQNEVQGVQMMEFSFAYLRNEVSVSESLLEAATRNRKSASTLLDMLLDYWTRDTIPESVIAAAVGNEMEGPFLVKMLQGRGKKRVHITNRILHSAFGNWESGAACIEQLLEESTHPTVIGGEAVSLRFGKRGDGEDLVLRWALSQPRERMVFSRDSVRTIFSMRSVTAVEKVMSLEQDFDLSEDLLLSAAGNTKHGASIFTFLFTISSNKIRVTGRLVTKAAKVSMDTLKVILLHISEGQDTINDRTSHQRLQLETSLAPLKAQKESICLDNLEDIYDEALNLLLDQPTFTIHVSKEVMSHLGLTDEILERLLTCPDDQVSFSSEVIMTIIREHGKVFTELFLHRRNVTLTHEYAEAIVKIHDVDTIALLLDKWHIELTRGIENAACQNPNAARVMVDLISRTSGCLSLNERMLEIIVNECEPIIIETYFQRLSPETWTRRMISIVVSCQSKSRHNQHHWLPLLLHQHPNSFLGQSLVEEIAESCQESVVAVALPRSKRARNDELVVAAMKNVDHGSGVLSMLFGDDLPKLEADPELIYNIARTLNADVLSGTIQRNRKVLQSLNHFLLLWAAAENRNYTARVIELVFNLNFNSSKSKKKRNQSCSVKAYEGSIPITESTIVTLAKKEVECGQNILRLLLRSYSDNIWITGTGFRAIIRSFRLDLIKNAVSHGGSQLQVDHLTIEASVGNRLEGPRILDFFLSQGSNQIEITAQTISTVLDNSRYTKELFSCLVASERVIFGQAATTEVFKSLDSVLIADLILSPRMQIILDDACISEAIAAMDKSAAQIFDFFQLLFSLNQQVNLTADMIRALPCGYFDGPWSSNTLEKVQVHAIFNGQNEKVSVTAPAMIEIIDRCYWGLKEHGQTRDENSTHWYNLLGIYSDQLAERTTIDEEVLVALLHSRHREPAPPPPSSFPLKFSFLAPVTEDWIIPRGRLSFILDSSRIQTFTIPAILTCHHGPVGITAGGAISVLKVFIAPGIYFERRKLLSFVHFFVRRCRMCQEFAVELARSGDENAMAILFNHSQTHVKATEDMLLAAVGRNPFEAKLVNYLLGLSPMSLTAEIVLCAAENSGNETLFRLLFRQPRTEFGVSEDLLVVMSRSGTSEIIDCLLAHFGPSSFNGYICEATLVAAANNQVYGGRILQTLLNSSTALPITEDVIIWAHHSTTVRWLWANLKPQAMTEEQVMNLLARAADWNPSIEFLETACSTFKPSILTFMADLHKETIDMSQILKTPSIGTDLRKLQENLMRKGLLEIVDGKWVIPNAGFDTDTRTIEYSVFEKDDSGVTDAFLTSEVIEDELQKENGDIDRIHALLSQRTRRAVVTKGAFASIIKHRDLGTVKLLVSGNGAIISPSILRTSFSTTGIREAMEDLPSGCSQQINIMESIVLASLDNNSGDNMEILRLMFVHFGCPTFLSNEVFIAAASGHNSPTQILELLLCCTGERICDPGPIALAAAINHTHGDSLLALLFDHLGNAIQVSEPLLVASAENHGTKYAFLQCVSRFKGQVSARVFASAAGNPRFGLQMSEFLLEKFQTPLTESVLVKAAGNETHGDKLLDLFFQKRNSEFKLTENILKAALKRQSHYHSLTGHYRVPELFLDPSLYSDPRSVQITATLSRHLSYSQFSVFLSKLDLPNPQALALELAQECNDVTLRMIVEEYGITGKLILSEELLKKAARNTHWRTNILRVFIYSLGHYGQVTTVTPAVVAAAAGNPKYGYESVQMLRVRSSGAPFVNSEALLAAVSNEGSFAPQLVRLVFRGFQSTPPITTELLSAAAKNAAHGLEILRHLLNRLEKQGGDGIVYDKVLEAAAANTTDMAKTDRAKQVEEIGTGWITAPLLWKDSEFVWYSPLGLLIRRKRHQISITENVLVAAAANPQNGKLCVLLLIKYAKELAITEKILMAAAKNPAGYEILTILLNHPRYQGTVSETLLAAGVSNQHGQEWKYIANLLLSQCAAPFPISEALVLAAAQSEHDCKQKMELLLRQYHGPICISDEVLEKVSPQLGTSICEKLQTQQTYSEAQRRTSWYFYQLCVDFVSCYIIWLLYHSSWTPVRKRASIT